MTSNTRILGSLRSAAGKGVVRMEGRLRHRSRRPVVGTHRSRRLSGWIGDVEGDLRLGGEFHFRFFC